MFRLMLRWHLQNNFLNSISQGLLSNNVKLHNVCLHLSPLKWSFIIFSHVYSEKNSFFKNCWQDNHKVIPYFPYYVMILCDMNLELYDIAENLHVLYQENFKFFQKRLHTAAVLKAEKTTVQARPFL